MSGISGVLGAGLTGMQKGFAQFNQQASNIASANLASEATTQLVENLVGLSASKLQIEASARVVQTASDTLGTLIDTYV